MCVFSLLSLLLIVDSGGTVVLVSQDGIQRPPLRFPRGGHLLQFLSCLENGLLPHGQLDPPLWSQRGKVGTPKLGLLVSPRRCGFSLVFPHGVSQSRAAGEDPLPAVRGCCIFSNPPPKTKEESGLEIWQFGLAHGLDQLNNPFWANQKGGGVGVLAMRRGRCGSHGPDCAAWVTPTLCTNRVLQSPCINPEAAPAPPLG